mmetsp:Transcript_33997/g.52840  ORF Transcript_33997/g.52840 Transcript_33997/m.52840 type:complete len:221 (-) Transcript_33997:166-828(-)
MRGFATHSQDAWDVEPCDVVVNWLGPGPNQQDLRELFSQVGQVRFVILQGDVRDYGKRQANVRFTNVYAAKKAATELDGGRLKGATLTVKWALAKEAWGGRAASDPKHEDLTWRFEEYVPPHPQHQRNVMEKWAAENPHEAAVQRHGVPFFGWQHDAVSRIGVRNNFGSDMARVEGRRLPAATAPQGHPRLRVTDREPMRNLPVNGTEDELMDYWNLEIT